jgi:TonB-linked SusC/RagA family outer membrane protein
MRNKFTILVFMSLFQVMAMVAQEKTVTGAVTASGDGMTLPGVNVIIKGSNQGTVTDMEGKYSINVSEAATLLFSSVGFSSKEVVVGNQTQINISLQENLQGLDEVVVTALGISREKKSLGYATQEVDGEDLNLTNEQNVLGSLSGRVAGVQVTGASGASMGGTQKIKIRGVNSIGGGDQPLIVVDGTPISNANFSGSDQADFGNLGQDVNPSDIESVNVLKGPAASALYGIRGQYGVIMITTKKGKRGAKDVSVQLNSSFSVERAGNFMPLQNLYGGGSSQSWRTLSNGDKYVDMSVDESWGPKMDGTPVRQVFSFYPQDSEYGQLTPFDPHPDNIKDYYETGFNMNNGVSVSGGSENSTFRLSLNDTRIEGVEPNTHLDRNNLGLNASLDLTDKLVISTNINYATNNAQRPSQGSEYGTAYFVQWFQRNLDMNRMKNYKYEDGTFLHWNLRRPDSETGEIANLSPLYWDNPYFNAYENTSNDYRDRFFGDVGLRYKVLPELELSAFIRSDMFTQNIESRTAFGGKRLPEYSVGKYQNKEMNYEFLAQYNKKFGEFSLNANLGGNIYDRRYSYLSMSTVGGLSAPGFYNIDASIDRPNTTSYLLRKQIRSGFGMVSVGFRDTYYLDASIRNDNSSALPEANNSYWYPSLSGSFVFSQLLDWDTLSFGKIRGSYAKAGSDLDPYQTTESFGVGTVYDGTNTSFVPDNLNNPTIEPSFAHSYETGMELRFFKNRLGFDFTYYEQKNKKQIISLDVSGASGYSSSTINAGLIENKGIELTINANPIQTDVFSWDATFNINRNRSMVVELAPGIDVYTYGSTTYSSVSSYLNSYVGEPFGSLIGQAYQRDAATGKILLGTDNMPLYTDATHNFGSVLPDFNGGLQNTIRIGQFDISAMIDFQSGGQFFSRSKMLAVRTGQDPLTVAINDNGQNVRDPLEDGGGVKISGISAETGEEVSDYVDARSYYRNVLGRRIYEEWLYDASYIKLREVRLGYTLNEKLLQSLPFKSVGIALIARNPAMIWQNAPKGIDPSEISTGSQSISWYESGQLVSVRSYGINLNITF